MKTVRTYLFLYDIGSGRRLAKVAKRVERENAARIQKSVYECLGTEERMDEFFSDVLGMIDSKTDKIALIPLSEEACEKTIFFGKKVRRPVAPERFILI